MKLLQNVPAITKAIIVAGMLGACQNQEDSVVSPIAEQANESNNENAKVSYFFKLLVGDGTVKLDYLGPFKSISKESHPSISEFTIYNYTNPKLIKATKYFSTYQTIKEESIYILNPEGKCIESEHTLTASGVKRSYIYQYKSNGQLEKTYNKDNTNHRWEFTYGPEINGKSNLTKMTFYDGNNKKMKEIAYSYYSGLDNSKLNPAFVADGRGKYLPIFGTFNVNLVEQAIETSYTSQPSSSLTVPHEFSYTHADGSISTVEEKIGAKIILAERKYLKLGITQ